MKLQRIRSKREDASAGILWVVIDVLFAMLACFWLAESKLQLFLGLVFCAVLGPGLFWVHKTLYDNSESE